jgi:hypothetical protein
LHPRVPSTPIHLPYLLSIHPHLAPLPSLPPPTMSQPHPRNPSTIAEHVVNAELCKKEKVCPSRTSSPPPLPRKSSHRLTYSPSTPILLASQEHAQMSMELSVYAPTATTPSPIHTYVPKSTEVLEDLIIHATQRKYFCEF